MTTQPKDKVRAALDRLIKKHGLKEFWAVYQSETPVVFYGPADRMTDEGVELLGKCLGWFIASKPILALRLAADTLTAVATFRAEQRKLRDVLDEAGEALAPKADDEVKA
jgi:hypothetical protein